MIDLRTPSPLFATLLRNNSVAAFIDGPTLLLHALGIQWVSVFNTIAGITIKFPGLILSFWIKDDLVQLSQTFRFALYQVSSSTVWSQVET